VNVIICSEMPSLVFLYTFHRIITFSTMSSYLHCWCKRSSAYSTSTVWNTQQYNSVSAKQGQYYYLVGYRLTSAVFSPVKMHKAITYICIILHLYE